MYFKQKNNCYWCSATLCLLLVAIQVKAQSASTVLPAIEQTTSSADDTGKRYTVSQKAYSLPDVVMQRRDGTKVNFTDELNDDRIVVLNFVYTSCNTICPMLSHLFAQVQTKLGEHLKAVHLVSVSLDPEHDTPKQLEDYAKKFQVGSSWDHYTGELAHSIAIQKALDVFRGDKMNHIPVVFIRPKGGNTWMRLEGFVGANDLLHEIESQL